MQSTNSPPIPPKSSKRERKRPLDRDVLEGHDLANETPSKNRIKTTGHLLLWCLRLFDGACGKCCNQGKCGSLTPDLISLISERAGQAIKADQVDRFFICLIVLACHLPDANLKDIWAEHDWIPADIENIVSSPIRHLQSLESDQEVRLYIENTGGFLDEYHMPEGEVLTIYNQLLSWIPGNTRSRNLEIPSSIIEPKDYQRCLAVFRFQVESILSNFVSNQLADRSKPVWFSKRYQNKREVKELKNVYLECALAVKAQIYGEIAERMESTSRGLKVGIIIAKGW